MLLYFSLIILSLYITTCGFLFQLISIASFAISFGMFLFTLFPVHYQRFYMPASFLCVFLLCSVTLLIFFDKSGSFMSPIGDLATSFQVIFFCFLFK